MQVNWQRLNRKTHYWGAILCAVPIIIVLTTGLLLQVKKEFSWIQPTTIKTDSINPQLSFDDILRISQAISEAEIQSWEDIDRLDIRPRKGVIKVRAINHWEIQLNQESGEVLAVNYRRSDTIESLHDGSFFFGEAKLYLFLPAAIILCWLWISGMTMFFKTYFFRRRHKIKIALRASTLNESGPSL